MASAWRSTFLSTFSFRPRLSVNAGGIEAWGELVTAACRVQPSMRLVRDSSGSATVDEAVLYTEAAVPKEALVWLPGVAAPADAEDTTGSLRPLAVYERRALLSAAVDHYEVHV